MEIFWLHSTYVPSSVTLCQLHTMQKNTQFNLPSHLISRINSRWKIGDLSYLSLVHLFISQSGKSSCMLSIVLFCNSKRKYCSVFFLLFSCSLAWPEPHNCSGIKHGWQMFLPLLPKQVLLRLSFGVTVSGGTCHPAHKGNKGSSLLQCQIKTNIDLKGQKGDNSTELIITSSHCRRIEQYNLNLNAWCLALLFPSEASKKTKEAWRILENVGMLIKYSQNQG